MKVEELLKENIFALIEKEWRLRVEDKEGNDKIISITEDTDYDLLSVIWSLDYTKLKELSSIEMLDIATWWDGPYGKYDDETADEISDAAVNSLCKLFNGRWPIGGALIKDESRTESFVFFSGQTIGEFLKEHGISKVKEVME